jgi:hypothetical protein
MSSLKRKLKNKKAPEGWNMIEEVVEDFEQQLKDAVAEENEGKRKCEASWKIHRIHWEKNRFIYDLMYVRKVMSRELVSRGRGVGRVGWMVVFQMSCESSYNAPHLVTYMQGLLGSVIV